MYRRLFKCRSYDTERRYKKYKNKLTNRLRVCEKDYYSKALQSYSNDIKNTWKILNEVINRKRASVKFTLSFMVDKTEIVDIVNSCESKNS